MKRLAVFTIFMTIIIALPVWAEGETAGSFTFVKGRVDITSPGGKARSVETGDIVNVGDIVRTKTGAKAEITFKDGSIIRLAQGSRMKINEYMVKKNQRRSFLSLFRGKLQGIVKKFAGFAFGRKRRNRFEVHTPTAVSGVRGTNFFTWFVNGVSGSAVKEGSVYVYPKDSPTFVRNINVGQAAVIKSASTPPVVKPATDVEIQEHIKDTAPTGEEAEKAAAPLAEAGIEAGLQEAAEEAGLGDVVETAAETIADTGLDVAVEENVDTFVENIGGLTPVEVLKYETVKPDSATSTFFAGDLNLSFLDTGSISGYIENDPLYPEIYSGQGGISLVGSYSGAGPGQAEVGTVNGVMDDQTAFNGNLGGVPGSWKGLFNSIYVSGGTFVSDDGETAPVYTLNNANAGYLYGALSGSFGDGKISASGTSYRSDILGQVDTISLGTVEDGQNLREVLAYSLNSALSSEENHPLPDLSSINVSNAIDNTVNDYRGSLSTITATKGTSVRNLGVWMYPATLPASYENSSGYGSWTSIYGQHDQSNTYYMLGLINGTDDKAGQQLGTGETGHVSVTGSLSYMDYNYYGDITLWHRGAYDPSLSYDSLTAGTFTRYPLAYSGDWGDWGGMTCLYTHENGSMVWAGSDLGIIGGRTSPWENRTSELIVYGQYDVDPGNGGAGYHDTYLFDTGINIDDGSGQLINGYAGGIWKITSTNNDETTFGKTYGSAVALYKDASENMGLIVSKDIAGIFYPDVNMFNALGTWVKDDPRLTGGFNEIGQGYMYYAYLSGKFINGGYIQGYLYDYGSTKYFLLDDSTSPPLGIYEMKFGTYNYYYDKTAKWSAKTGGYASFGASSTDAGYWLADITNGTWTPDVHAEINGTMEGIYLTETHKGNIGGPFYGINTADGTEESSWAGESVGIFEAVREFDFGGSAGGDLSYNDDGSISSSGDFENTFGLTMQNDGNYEFMTLGDYYDEGYGVEGYGYMLSSSFSGDEVKENGNETTANLEAFSAGIGKNTGTDDMVGGINSHVVAITLQDDGTAGLLSGDAGGNFYEMSQDSMGYDYGTYGMWKTAGVLEKNDKIIVPTNLVSYSPSIDILGNEFNAELAGSFTGSSESAVYGVSDDLNSMTEFIRYTLPGDIAASLPWGIHYLDLAKEGGTSLYGYSGKPSGSTSWIAKIGGKGTFGFDENTDGHGFWLADVNGTWHEYQPGAGHGDIDGTFSNGIYLSTTQMGNINGWLYGLYTRDGVDQNSGLGYGTWAAQSVGTFKGEPLAFSSVLNGDEFYLVPGTAYEGNYEIPEQGQYGLPDYVPGYDYEYFIADNSDKPIFGETFAEFENEETDNIYLPNGEHIIIIEDGPPGITAWDPGISLDTDDFTIPPEGSYEWIKTFENNWTTHSVAKAETGINGILGGTTSMWNENTSSMESASINMLGTYSPHISSAEVYDPLLFSMKLKESGIGRAAYNGYMNGIIDGITDTVAGNLYALYIDPKNNAGIMTGDFSGQTYPSIKMLDASGTVDFEQKASDVTIAAADLENNLKEGFITGELGSSNEQFFNGSMGFGKTVALADHKDWGIFNILYGYDSKFDIQSASSHWKAGGYGSFGINSSGGNPDFGSWIASAANMNLDTPTENMLITNFTGNFLTLTQYGDINADFLGSYDSVNDAFMGTISGCWNNGQNLKFNGIIDSENDIQRIVEERHGYWNDENGSFYNYGYFPGKDKGWSDEYNASTMEKIHKNYRSPGPDGNGIVIIMTEDGQGNVTFSSDTWQKETSLYDDYLIHGPQENDVPYDYTYFILMEEGFMDGIMGGLDDLWTADDSSRAGIRLMGEYETDCEDITALPRIYSMNIESVNPYNDTRSLENGGAYIGRLTGRILETDEIQGWIYALYIDPDKNAGILKGSYGWIIDDLKDGSVWPEIEMWSADGGIYPIQICNDYTTYQNIAITDRQSFFGGYGILFDDGGADIGEFDYINGKANFISLYDESTEINLSWGVWNSLSGGTYNTSDLSLIDHWMMRIDQGEPDQNNDDLIVHKSVVFDVANSQWTNRLINNGMVLGAWADLDEVMEPVTGVLSGELAGTFDPVKATWQTAESGSWIETKKFLGMTAVDENGNYINPNEIEKLNKLDIPSVRIGKTDLTGNNNNLYVNMNDVTFFAYSAGAAPKIWATENVNGSYNNTPSLRETVNLSGNGLNAAFTVRNWEVSKWGAQITGGGTFNNAGNGLNGRSVRIDGVAAGTYNDTYKTFVGTGAGVSHKMPTAPVE